MTQGRRSRNERPHGTVVVRTVSTGRRTCAEEPHTQGSKDDRNRKVLVDGFRRLTKIRDEEEEHGKIRDELLEKRRIQADELWSVFEDKVQSWEPSKEGWQVNQKPRPWKMTGMS